MGEEGAKNLFQNILKMWIEPELDRRIKEGKPYIQEIDRCLILLPKNHNPIVKFNEENGFIAKVRKAPNTSFEKDQIVNIYEIKEVISVKAPTYEERRVGFVFLILISDEWHIFFDFSPNWSDDEKLEDEWNWSMGKDIAQAYNMQIHERIIKGYANQIEELDKIGLWSAPALFPYPLSLILQKLSQNDQEGARSVLLSFCDSKFLQELSAKWYQLPPFSKRRTLIEKAISSHIQGNYELSIPALVPQVEGIMNEWLVSRPLKNDLPKHQIDIVKKFAELTLQEKGSFTYKHFAESSSKFLIGPVMCKIEEWKKKYRDVFPNRHVITGHGEYDEKLYSQENSIKVILLLDTIYFLIKDTYPQSAKSTDFGLIVETFEQMEQTSSRLALTDYLVALFKKTPADIIDKVTYLIQGKLYPDYEGIELGIAEKMVIRAIAGSSGKDHLQVEKIYQKTGDLGDTASEVLKSKNQLTFVSEPMTIERVYSTFDRIAHKMGSGSQETKLRIIRNLLHDSTATEGRYIVKFIMGQLRLGIADYTVLDALAIAFTDDKENRKVLENAYNVSSDLGTVAKLLATKGLKAVKSIKITLFKPIRPMLAERVKTAEEALERMGDSAAVEYKLDGERVQVHKDKDKVELFSRRLEKITNHYPDIVDAVRSIKHDIILEGEVVAINPETEEYLPFQELMHRRRKYGIEEAMVNYPVVINFFDVLYINGKSQTDLLYTERRYLLEKIVNEVKEENNKLRLIKQTIATKPEEIDRFMATAIENGCEGVMIKQISSTYRAGAREYAWVKLKREYASDLTDTLDLVIVGALHGRGRRAGKYGALLLAAYDQKADMFQSITKVGTGFTDVHLEQFYNDLEKHVIRQRHARVQTGMEMDVWFEPKIVIEVIASEITLSPSHTAAKNVLRPGYGLALRFPKFTGKIRDDKKPEDATSVDEVVTMYKRQLKVAGGAKAEEG